MIGLWVHAQLLRGAKERRRRVAPNLPEPVRKETFSALSVKNPDARLVRIVNNRKIMGQILRDRARR